MMFCANCYKEIPAGKSYYKHQDTNQSYCSLDCLNDHMIYSHTITLEMSEGAESTEGRTMMSEGHFYGIIRNG